MNNIKIKPLGRRIVFEKITETSQTSSGIFIPFPKERTTEGIVVEVFEPFTDESGKLQNPILKIGQKVVVSEYMGTNFVLDNRKLSIIKESEVLAIIDDSTSK